MRHPPPLSVHSFSFRVQQMFRPKGLDDRLAKTGIYVNLYILPESDLIGIRLLTGISLL